MTGRAHCVLFLCPETGVTMLQGKRSGKVNKWGLSEAHEAYCQRRAQGAAPADAYLETVATKADMDKYHATIHACKLERLEKI